MDAPDPGRREDADAARPLTRRELRARAAAASAATDDGADAVPEAGSWDVAVGWAVRREVPSLPPEPDEPDDVRWDPVGAGGEPPAVRVDELHPEQTPARAAWATQFAAEAWAPPPPKDPPPVRRRRVREVVADDSGAPSAGPPVGPRDPDDTAPVVIAGLADGGLADSRLDEAIQGDTGRGDDAFDAEILDVETPDAETPDAEILDVETFDAVETPAEPDQPRRVSVLGSAAGLGAPPAPPRPPVWGPAQPRPLAVTPPVFARPADEVPDDAPPPRTVPQPAPSSGYPVVPAVQARGATTLPTLDDLLATRAPAASGPAEIGWRGVVRRITGGAIALPPGVAEREDRGAVASVQRAITGPRTVVVINPKGGAHKTTAALMIAATFGRHRGGYTLAWDNNETRGTLGWRSRQSSHHRTAVDLLDDLERFADPDSSRVGDLDAYVRAQGSAQFDVLASDEDAASAASIDDFAFRALHRTLTRFYRVLVVDTGNNMRASNWQAAVEAADQVVVVSTMREDTAQSAAWALDALRATGHEATVRKAVTVLSQPAPRRDDELAERLHDHFGQLTRDVLEVPYEPALVSGGPIDYEALSDASRRAWLHVTATVAEGL